MNNSYPNQKRIVVHKLPCDSTHKYGLFNKLALQFAMQNLKNSSFKLWAYLASNQNGYSFLLSAAECSAWGIKSDAYHNAVKDLISKSFLVKSDEYSTQYSFYEIPKEVLQTQMIQAGYYMEKP